MIGSTIGHFEIRELLGKGGMGEVYKAEDTKLHRPVALKFLSRELGEDPVFCERFLREARAIAALNHPHICTIFETGEHEGRLFFAMEYLEGRTLKEMIADGPLDLAMLDRMAMQLADALAAAHAKGILHRDLKPANIICDPQGKLKLFDFGLAKDLRPDRTPAHAADARVDEPSPLDATATMAAPEPAMLTRVGSTLGTFAYMSPEQVRGEELDERSDLFALGLVLFELATGRRAFTGSSMPTLIDAVLNHPVPAPVTIRPDLSPQLNAVIQRLTAKNRESRLASAATVREALMLANAIPEDAARGDGDQAFLSTLGRKRSPWGVIVGLIGVVVVSFGAGLTTDEADAGLLPAVIALIGLMLVFCGVLIWWREGRKIRRERTGSTLRITRLEEESPGRIWLYSYIVIWMVAIVTSVLLGHRVWALAVKRSSSVDVADLVLLAAYSLFSWISVIKGRRWRDAPPARRSQEIEIQASYAQILSRISTIITDLDAQVTGLHLEKGVVRATTSFSLKTWGSRLSFTVTEKNRGVFTVLIVSEPVLPFELLEFGRNKANVRRSIELLVQG